MEKMAAVLVYFAGTDVPKQHSLGLFETYASGMRYAYDNFGPIIRCDFLHAHRSARQGGAEHCRMD